MPEAVEKTLRIFQMLDNVEEQYMIVRSQVETRKGRALLPQEEVLKHTGLYRREQIHTRDDTPFPHQLFGKISRPTADIEHARTWLNRIKCHHMRRSIAKFEVVERVGQSLNIELAVVEDVKQM